MASQTYDSLNKAWKSTCRVLFGMESGELSDCAIWLSEYQENLRTEKSTVSKKPLTFTLNDYASHAKYVAFDEIDFNKKFAPLSINEIKDIDSIADAIGERAYYCGNVILGNSAYVQNSNNVTDSHFVLCSNGVVASKNVAYSTHVKNGEGIFGVLGSERSAFAIKSMGSDLRRCFECHMAEMLSDGYYCAKVQNSHDCMFCFGMENGAYCIGNSPINREKYLQIKNKLCGEIAESLKKNGKVFSLLEVIEKSYGFPADKRIKQCNPKKEKFDKSPVQGAFDSACGLIFGKPLGDIQEYGDYLHSHVPRNIAIRSSFGGESIVCGYRRHIVPLYKISTRLVSEDEMREIGRIGIDASRLGLVDFDPESLGKIFHPVAYTNLDKWAGINKNVSNGSVIISASDCFEGSAFIRSKKCAYCFWTSNDEAIFGSYAVFDSSFSINCYLSTKISRAFEADACTSCNDIMFSHNCENVRDSMFCFNAKNLSYSIGNAPLAPNEYRKIKSSVVSQIYGELERKKSLKWNIFNIGEKK